VALGTPFGTACRFAGITPSTGYDWLQKGEHPARAPIYTEFSDAVAQAQAQDEMRRIGRIEQAARGGAVTYRKTTTYEDGRTITEERTVPPDWQADAWHLERRLPDQWGRKERLEHTGMAGGPLQIQVVYEDEQEAPLVVSQAPVRLLIKEG
jgi:hypothetical protein